jgi:glycogen operon protein
VTSFILRSLEHWTRLGVDGFRFDLASVLTRGEDGAPLANPALTWGIELSSTLQHKPVIAEAWDAAGLYQVGAFPGMRWTEWNGRYRDVIRGFVRGDPGLLGEVATRISGSEDLYRNRTPLHSINFITCHDGFTLNDLVSYNHKHNEANGEDNRDGSNDNLSWNCGQEGDTRDPSILALRARQAKNLMAILFLSQGAPMILAGDEVLRSQQGNNNVYCQDNELSWFDWRLVETQRSMLRFTRELIALRKRHPSLRRKRFLTGRTPVGRNAPDIVWYGERLDAPPWHDRNAKLLAFTLSGLTADEPSLHVILNMSHENRVVAVPRPERLMWRRAVDTALASPEDIEPYEQQAAVVESCYAAQPRSVVVLEAH